MGKKYLILAKDVMRGNDLYCGRFSYESKTYDDAPKYAFFREDEIDDAIAQHKMYSYRKSFSEFERFEVPDDVAGHVEKQLYVIQQKPYQPDDTSNKEYYLSVTYKNLKTAERICEKYIRSASKAVACSGYCVREVNMNGYLDDQKMEGLA